MSAAAHTLLRQCLTEEALRRMCRKAGVLSIARTGDRTLNDAIRTIALRMLTNIGDKIDAMLQYNRTSTLTLTILNEALRALSVKTPLYHDSSDNAM